MCVWGWGVGGGREGGGACGWMWGGGVDVGWGGGVDVTMCELYNASNEYKREENTLEGNNIPTFTDAANETPLFCFIL